MKLKNLCIILLISPLWMPSSTVLSAQENVDEFFIKNIYDHSLQQSQCYTWLSHLSEDIGGRLAGSPGAAAAVEYTRQVMSEQGFDTVKLQPCAVPYWVRGDTEIVKIVNSDSIGTVSLSATSLGNSIGTGPAGITGEVIEVMSLDVLMALDPAAVAGKIVFFNRPMDPTQLHTFRAYGGAVDQRGSGPAVASSMGAIAAIVRSMTTKTHDVPHTGVTVFSNEDKLIPALAISTLAADRLSALMQHEDVKLYVENHCELREGKKSYNVIGEIKGSKYPDEIILVGGHLDSWDIGGGAHDDGAGCVHSIQSMVTLLELGYQPQRTWRCVMFMNEENGLGGALAYAAESNKRGEYHMAAIESDAGGFTPRALAVGGDKDIFEQKFAAVRAWRDMLSSYGVELTPGGGGADINPLKSQQGLLFGLRPDSQRYFDFHHTALDKIDAVNQRELELGAAAMASLVYLLDKYGIDGE